MTTPNRATLWGRTLVEELVASGIGAVCVAPGSRSTPLTVAFAQHPAVTVYSHLDERSAAFFALGRARRTGEPTALVCTSGTAAANFHPAVIEADQARVPLLVLTADRPAELRDSGANQTIDQRKLYGDAVRWYAELPVPEPNERALRMLRTTAARALSKTTGTPAGPVHLNCPFRKPLEPTSVPESVPDGVEDTLAGTGREGPFVRTTGGETTLPGGSNEAERIARALEDASRPLVVAGPADPPVRRLDPDAVIDLATAVGAPIFADPLSGVRFGPHLETHEEGLVCGGYDSYADTVPDPDVVLRIGDSPTSRSLSHALRDADCRQFLIDPAGEWREATFTATDLVVAEPQGVLEAVTNVIDHDRTRRTAHDGWLERIREAETTHWQGRDDARTAEALEAEPFEGAILASVFEDTPDSATVFVSNSMPIRDADRFGRPRAADLTVLANRGASGIDGITSTALGAGSATDDPLVLVTGDLAFYHDSNGLLALERCGVDATIVLLDNDGGGIFHLLPIESFDPPFTGQFKTPHGLEFDPLGELYGFEMVHVEPTAFADAYIASLESPGTQVISVSFDAETSHRRREELEKQVREACSTNER
ncbi:2-succinyl-5-enolpyruvyl-6-hydroxy-3-cyclohexene-1-carboxylic-acid synthase [Natrialbaceae archaeon A-CW3]